MSQQKYVWYVISMNKEVELLKGQKLIKNIVSKSILKQYNK